MMTRNSLLVKLLSLIDQVPLPSESKPRRRGRPYVYPTRLIVKLWIVMIFRRIRTPYALHRFLSHNLPEVQELRKVLFGDGPMPSRRTIERRLSTLAEALHQEIVTLGYVLLARLRWWDSTPAAAAAIDSVTFHACGGVWHKEHQQKGIVPDSRIDTEAGWTKSGWHGWVYGWKLHVIVTASKVLIPLVAWATPANTADNVIAYKLVSKLPKCIRWLLGDTSLQDEKLEKQCASQGIQLVAPRRGGIHPRQDPGAQVRRVLHTIRDVTIERFFAHFKDVFELVYQVPTRGRMRTTLFLLGCVYVYQLVLLLQLDLGQQPMQGFKALLQAI